MVRAAWGMDAAQTHLRLAWSGRLFCGCGSRLDDPGGPVQSSGLMQAILLLGAENNRQPVCAEMGLLPQLSCRLPEPSSDQLGKFSTQLGCFFH